MPTPTQQTFTADPEGYLSPETRKAIAERIKSDINKYCEEKYNTGHREHLGASIMGEPCSRKLWYNFRHVKEEVHEGRIQRLFQVGHNAEPRFIEYLRAIGFEVWERDPTTGKQFRISAVNGHYGGSLDGICKAPERYGLKQDLIFLNEFKTNGTGAGYTSVEKDGIMRAKPRHFAQMSQYAKHFKINYGLYLIENKNDSDITIEIVELDWELGQRLENRAKQIIESQISPNKINENPSYFECKYCTFVDICHHKAPVEKNCRSCKCSKPVENSNWYCTRFQNTIPYDFLKIGCEFHVSINT